MLKLAILADDLTGALDTGVQFSACGVRTAVTVGTVPPGDCTAAVCDLETRQLSPAAALARTREAMENVLGMGTQYLYCKTDSGLRGNVGAALEALSADGEPVLFAPAYPENRRITAGGVHYVDGVPVSRSLFGRDALTPVRHDRIADILRDTGAPEITTCSGVLPERLRGVLAADAETDEDLDRLAETALRRGIVRFAGCAGLAKQLVRRLTLPRDEPRALPEKRPLLVLCGSISPVSLTQLQRAQEAGLPCFTLREAQKAGTAVLSAAMAEQGCAAVASARDEAEIRENNDRGWTAESVAAGLGEILRRTAEATDCGFFVIGGDTLMAAIRALGSCAVFPIHEAESGVVVCTLRRDEDERLLITKSGSFGGPDTVVNTCIRFGAV